MQVDEIQVWSSDPDFEGRPGLPLLEARGRPSWAEQIPHDQEWEERAANAKAAAAVPQMIAALEFIWNYGVPDHLSRPLVEEALRAAGVLP